MMNNALSDKIRVIVINRAKDVDRRKVMTERLNALGLRHEFFEAVDGHSFNAHEAPEYDGRKRRLHFGRDLSSGEIGCLLSHRGVCQKMVAEDIPLALVLEDDTFFKPDFPQVLESLLATDVAWDMIRFLNWDKIFRGAHRVLGPLNPGYELARIQATPGGAYAYLLTRHAAEEMVRHTERNWLPIDSLQGRGWQTGLNVLVTKPSPVAADFDVPSTIGEGRFEKKATVTGLTRLVFPLFRFWFKCENGLGKRFHYWLMSRKDAKSSNAGI
ncbi:MAG: glycosyl transferase family 25 [Sneathiella sp.]|jgi:glycosyl transferase family 25